MFIIYLLPYIVSLPYIRGCNCILGLLLVVVLRLLVICNRHIDLFPGQTKLKSSIK